MVNGHEDVYLDHLNHHFMITAFLHDTGSSEAAKFIAWLTAAGIALAGLLVVKQFVAGWLLKLYEYFIQHNSAL
jgi:hypothetical protein